MDERAPDSGEVLARLEQHYDTGSGLYKLWASPNSVLAAMARGWGGARHPAQLHYAWDLEQAQTLDDGIRRTTLEALQWLDIDGIARPHIFDAGCGIGGATTQISLLRPQAEVEGMSIVARQVRIAQDRARVLGVGNAAFHCGNYLRTGLPQTSFDGIYAIESFCYTPTDEKSALFAEMYRLLRPGRRLVIIDGCSRRDATSDAERHAIQDVLDGWTMPTPTPASQMAALARQAGFELLHCEDVTAHVLRSADRIAAIGARLLRPLAALARWPGMAVLLSPLGFASPAVAARFADACVSQRQVLRCGMGAYYVHVLQKPA
jgi:cyclopropane fatty-acyl-phospholipid synthase-like methyltransferase